MNYIYLKKLQQHWLKKRITEGSHTLNSRSVFIMPTRQGFYLLLFLIAMLIGCINYNLSLGYLLTFFIFSIGLGAMYRTHQNLLGICIELLPTSPVFAGELCILKLKLSTNVKVYYGLSFTLQDTLNSNLNLKENYFPIVSSINLKEPLITNNSINNNINNYINSNIDNIDNTFIYLELNALKRGEYHITKICIETTYPLGLWKAWSYVFPSTASRSILVYPALTDNHIPLAKLIPLQQSADNSIQSNYQTTPSNINDGIVSHLDSNDYVNIRHLHWASLAKGIVANRVLETDDKSSNYIVQLSFSSCSEVSLEAQLSQLCASILFCQKKNIYFILYLNDELTQLNKNYYDINYVNDTLAALARY